LINLVLVITVLCSILQCNATISIKLLNNLIILTVCISLLLCLEKDESVIVCNTHRHTITLCPTVISHGVSECGSKRREVQSTINVISECLKGQRMKQRACWKAWSCGRGRGRAVAETAGRKE